MSSPQRASIPRPQATGERHTPRVGVDHPVEIFTGDFPGPLLARSRDLGVGGACLATASPFSFKSVRRLAITLPGERLEVEAEGRWQHELPGDDLVLTGVSFLEPPAEVVERLWDTVLETGKQLSGFLCTRSDLRDLALEEALGLAQVTRLREVPAGRFIYRQDRLRQGEDSIFLVWEGTVTLQVRVRDARETTVDELGPGRLFGGLPLLADVENAESALAHTNVRLLEIDRRAWSYLLAAKPWLAHRLAQVVVRSQATRARELLVRVRDQL